MRRRVNSIWSESSLREGDGGAHTGSSIVSLNILSRMPCGFINTAAVTLLLAALCPTEGGHVTGSQ